MSSSFFGRHRLERRLPSLITCKHRTGCTRRLVLRAQQQETAGKPGMWFILSNRHVTSGTPLFSLNATVSPEPLLSGSGNNNPYLGLGKRSRLGMRAQRKTHLNYAAQAHFGTPALVVARPVFVSPSHSMPHHKQCTTVPEVRSHCSQEKLHGA